MNYAMITGASRGLGESIAKQMIKQNIGVVSVSRTENKDLKAYAEEQAVFYTHYNCHLDNPDEIERVFTAILDEVNHANRIYVINNAGVIDPIEVAGKMEANKLAGHVQVNLLAPMLITNLILQKADTEVIIANVTSGAAERAVYGWSAYCSTKAGINRFTETVALEQEELKTNNKIIAFSPGVMDTDMQQEIRSSSKDAFIEVEKFQGYKENGQLRDTDTVGKALVQLMLSGNLDNGKIYRVNELL